MKHFFLLIAAAITSMNAHAQIHTETIEYRHGDAVMEGYLAYDTAVKGKRPAVLVVPEWWGLNDYPKKRAEQLAQLGCLAFAADIYGNGVVAKTPQEAGALAGKFRNDRALMRARVTAALDVVRAQELTDPKRIAAIGYCFGGTTALELARSGADIAGVVSFHGGLSTPNPSDAKNIKCKVLVCHGGDDPNVPVAEVEAFEREMRDAKVDWQINIYGGAVHSFTNPASGNDPSRGAAYNKEADARSWEAMKSFFAEIFK